VHFNKFLTLNPIYRYYRNIRHRPSSLPLGQASQQAVSQCS
jgi:hypothetical protein